MSTNFDVKGTITAIVSAGSIRMLNKLQQEFRETAVELAKMGDTATANALGHMSMAMGRVAQGAVKASGGVKSLATNATLAAQTVGSLTKASEKQKLITEQLAAEWKFGGGEIQGLSKAVGMLGQKYTYSANAQKAWVPALRASLTEINKQKAAMVASGMAVSAHVTGQELFDRTNRNLAQGLKSTRSGLTDYDKAMEKALGRSPAFRSEIEKISGAVGTQGAAFKSQVATLTKVDNTWREHVTSLHRAGTITTQQAQKMYDSYQHLGLSARELGKRIKVSNGELLNAANYNKAARVELDQHTKSMAVLNKAEEKLAAVSGKSLSTIQAETNAMYGRTKSISGAVTEINKQTAAYKATVKEQGDVVKKEAALAKATGARISSIQEITKRMQAQGASYAEVSQHLDALTKKHSTAAGQIGRVSKASDELRKTNKSLAGEIDALGRIKLKNIAAIEGTTKSLEGLARKYPMLSKEVSYLSQKVAAGHMPVATADKLLNQMRAGMGQTTVKASLLSRAMSSLVSHMKSFAAYAAAATIISAVVATFGFAISAVVKYNQALYDLQAITQSTDREVALMNDKIREVGRTTKFSAIEVAAAMRTLGQAGFTATEALGSIDSVAALAAGTLTNIDLVVDLITTAIRAFDLETSEATRVTDIFANAVNRSKLTIDKLRIAFNYIGPIAAEAGIEIEETTAMTMLLANAGIRASTMGTGLRRTIQQLIQPTEAFKAALEAAGYTTEDFNTQTNSMRDIIRRLSIVVPDAEAAFKMFALRSASVVAALSSKGVAGFDALLSATKRTGSALEMQAKQLEGLGLIYKQAMDKATDLALALGKAGVTGALRVLGNSLQWVLDQLIRFVGSGVGEAVLSIGAWVAALYAVKAVWGLLKIEAMAASVMALAVNIGCVTTATGAWELALAALSKRFVLIAIAAGILYGLYKLLFGSAEKNVEVSTDWVKAAEAVRAEERKRLEKLRNLVTLIRDETVSERRRSDALLELQATMGDLNLEVDKSTGIIKNQEEVISENKDRLDEWEDALGAFDNSAMVTQLLEAVQVYEDTEAALKEQIKLVNEAKLAQEGLSESEKGVYETTVDWAKSLDAPLLTMISRQKELAAALEDRTEGYNKLADEHTKAHGKMATGLMKFGDMTQKVWAAQMVQAGASYEGIEHLVTDATALITEEHLKMYLELLAARDGYTEQEKKGVKKALDLFYKLTHTKEALLNKEIIAVREAHSDRLKIVSEAYDEEIERAKRLPDLSGKVYDRIADIVAEKAKKKLTILEMGYEKEKQLILNSGMSAEKMQDSIADLEKTTANRKVAIFAEANALLNGMMDERLSRAEAAYKREADSYKESIDRRTADVNSYYDFEIAKTEAQLEHKRATGETLVNLEGGRLREIAELGGALVSLEQARYNEIAAIAEESFSKRLIDEDVYHKRRVQIAEDSLDRALELYKEDDEKRGEAEAELNEKLVEISKESVEARYELLTEWSDYLKDKYDTAVEHTREYALAVIKLEQDIQDIRRKTAEQLEATTEKTKNLLLKVAQAGMTEAQKAASDYAEACKKKTQADELMATEVAANVDKAIKLYQEYQEAMADLGVAAAQAHKKEVDALKEAYDLKLKADKLWGEGHKKEAKKLYDEWKEKIDAINKEKIKLPVTPKAAEDAIKAVEDQIIAAQEKAGDLAEIAKKKEIEVAQERADQWKLVADMLNTRFVEIGKNLDEIVRDRSMTITVYYDEVNRPDTLNKAKGGVITRASGGTVPGTGTGDTVPAMLTPGEFVVKKDSVSKFGVPFLSALNAGLLKLSKLAKFEAGGVVGGSNLLLEQPVDTKSLRKMVSSIINLADKLTRVPAQPAVASKEGETLGRYEFVLNIGSAVLSGRTTKSVLDRFQSELRRQELVRGLPA
ncbi:MAG: phage tail tape measure protein [Deltaproteobacteria bacterium]|nr:MAG: phage tail tape measure protein [Deltaproteobacteria bacterium]